MCRRIIFLFHEVLFFIFLSGVDEERRADRLSFFSKIITDTMAEHAYRPFLIVLV